MRNIQGLILIMYGREGGLAPPPPPPPSPLNDEI